MFYEAALSANWFARSPRSENWFARSPRSASTPADRSKRATQLSPWGCSARFVPAVFGPFGFAVHQSGDSVYGISRKSRPVQETGDSVYGTVRKSCLVHQIGDSLYGTVQKFCLVHRSSCLVYGDKDYDENGQEKGAYFGRWRRICSWRRICCGGQEKGAYFGRLGIIRRCGKGYLFWCCLVYGALSRSSTPYTEWAIWCTG